MAHFLAFLSTFLVVISSLIAQSAIVPVGGAIGNNQVSYTVGQIDYTSNSASNGSVNEGVQQPYEFYIVGELENESISMVMTVFPNPTQSELFLAISDINIENLSLKLYNIEGKLILEESISKEKTMIDIQKESQGTYLLSVFKENKVIQTFRIIKNR